MAFNAAAISDDAGKSQSLYLGGPYGGILDFLCSPLTGRANVKVLISEAGLGKTVLLRAALERMRAEARTVFVFWTLFKRSDFIAHLLFEMGSRNPPAADLKTAQNEFEILLRRAATNGKRLVIAIDEAHHLSTATLKSLSALLDRDTAHPPQVMVLLAGLPRLQHRLADHASGLRERIAGVMSIGPLNADQTAEYITYRANKLGVDTIAPEQLANIAAAGAGALRRIDQLCHHVLLQNGNRQLPLTEIREDTSNNETSTSAHSQLARLADWATQHCGMWSGTAAELAAATGISAEDVAYLVENCSCQLAASGIVVIVERSPGKPRMITLSRKECEQPGESPSGNSSEMYEVDVGVQPVELPVNPPELDGVQTGLQPEHTSEELQTARWLEQVPAGEERDRSATAADKGPVSRRTRRASQAAGVLVAAMVIAGGLLYLHSSNGGHQGSSLRQSRSAPGPSARMDDGTGMGKPTQAGEIDSQSTNRAPVPPEHEKPSNLYQQAAMRGDAVAQHRLGLALSSGSNGVAADRVAGYAWLVLARDGGEPVAQATLDSLSRSLTGHELLDVRYKLGMMHEHGIGCSPDVVLADEWFLLGAAGGDARSGAESTALEKRMSADQISQAHARSDDWLRRHTAKPTTNTAGR